MLRPGLCCILRALVRLILCPFLLAISFSVLFACLAIFLGSLAAPFVLLLSLLAGESITLVMIAKEFFELVRYFVSLAINCFPWLFIFFFAVIFVALLADLISGEPDSNSSTCDCTLRDFREEVKRRELEAQAKGLGVYKETFMMSRQLETLKGSAEF